MSDKGGWVGQQCRKENDLCLSHELSLFLLYLLPLGSRERQWDDKKRRDGQVFHLTYFFSRPLHSPRLDLALFVRFYLIIARAEGSNSVYGVFFWDETTNKSSKRSQPVRRFSVYKRRRAMSMDERIKGWLMTFVEKESSSLGDIFIKCREYFS